MGAVIGLVPLGAVSVANLWGRVRMWIMGGGLELQLWCVKSISGGTTSRTVVVGLCAIFYVNVVVV